MLKEKIGKKIGRKICQKIRSWRSPLFLTYANIIPQSLQVSHRLFSSSNMPISVCTFEKLETFKNFRRTTVTSRCGCYTTAWKGPFKRDSRTLDCQIVSGRSWECRILRGVMLNVKFNSQRNKRWHKTRTYTPQRNNVINLFQRGRKIKFEFFARSCLCMINILMSFHSRTHPCISILEFSAYKANISGEYHKIMSLIQGKTVALISAVSFVAT